jgi:hypothetical protein
MKEEFEKIRKKLDEESVMRANSEKFYSEPQNGEYVDCVVLLKDALSIVSEVEAEYGNEWIPVERALPESEKRVLCLHEHKVVDCGHYIEKEWYCDLDEYSTKRNKVIAWMPLPEPYRVNHEAELPFSDAEESEVEE